MKRLLQVIIIIFIFASYPSFAQDVSSLIADADAVNERNYSQAYTLYQKVLDVDPNNYHATWNLAFLCTKIGNLSSNRDEKAKLFLEAKGYAEKALDLKPRGLKSNYVMGVVLGRMGDISDSKERVENVPKIKKHLDIALAADSTHARTWHLYGKLYYRLANLNFAERAAAKLLYGGIPFEPTNAQAISFYKKAINYRSDYILYYLDLGIALIKAGDQVKAKEVLEKGLTINPYTEEDPVYVNNIKELLKRIRA